MAANALVQTRINPAVKAQATEVLERMGLTVSDAVRILLTRTAQEGALPFPLASDSAAHDAWFRARVEEALDDRRPRLSNEQVKIHFAARRASALAGSKE
jgi:DNA-damage-inducible protein J